MKIGRVARALAVLGMVATMSVALATTGSASSQDIASPGDCPAVTEVELTDQSLAGYLAELDMFLDCVRSTLARQDTGAVTEPDPGELEALRRMVEEEIRAATEEVQRLLERLDGPASGGQPDATDDDALSFSAAPSDDDGEQEFEDLKLLIAKNEARMRDIAKDRDAETARLRDATRKRDGVVAYRDVLKRDYDNAAKERARIQAAFQRRALSLAEIHQFNDLGDIMKNLTIALKERDAAIQTADRQVKLHTDKIAEYDKLYEARRVLVNRLKAQLPVFPEDRP